MFNTNEMSLAAVDRKKNKAIWVENPNTHNNKYFKYYNSSSYLKADKLSRISLLEPEYIVHKGSNWVLTNKEKKELIEILNEDSDFPGLTNWQRILGTYNFDNYFLGITDWVSGNYNITDYPNIFPLDYQMPDYTKLPDKI